MQNFFPKSINFTQTNIPIKGSLCACFTFSLVFALDPRIPMPNGYDFILQKDCPSSTVLDPSLVWSSVMASMEKETIFDYGVPKLYSEWLMAGSAFGHGQKALSVAVQAGLLSREFLVTGESQDLGVNMIDPKPFDAMPLTWRNTYGGKGYPENPLGKGRDKNTEGIVELPCVYEKSSFTQNLEKKPACPQGRSALTMAFHGQTGFNIFPNGMGTYDATWLQNNFPGAPNDFDWKFYNLAQPSQIMSETVAKGAVFNPLDGIHIQNMHAECPEIRGQIPPHKLRFFIEFDQNPCINIDAKIPLLNQNMPLVEGSWHEIPVQADTLWLLPNQNIGILLWHASAPTVSEANIDMLRLAAYLEDSSKPALNPADCIALALMQDQVKAEEVPPLPEITPQQEEKSTPLKMPAVAGLAVGLPLADLEEESPFTAPEIPTETPKAQADERDELLDEASIIATGIATANEELAKLGLPPLDEADIKAKMEALSKQADEAMEAEAPSPLQMLTDAGIPPEQAQSIVDMTEVELPIEVDFDTPEAFKKALDEYLRTIALISPAVPISVDAIKNTFNELEKAQEAYAEIAQASDGSDAILNLLKEGGLSSEESQNFANAINLAIPEDPSQESLMTYFEAFDSETKMLNGELPRVANNIINETRSEYYSITAEAMLGELANVTVPPHEAVAFDIFREKVKELSVTKAFPPNADLSSLAIACGIASAPLLTAIYEIDPFPFNAPPKAPELEAPVIPPLEEAKAELPPVEAPAPVEATAEEEYKTPTNAEEFKTALEAKIDLTAHNMAGIDLSNLDISMLDAESLALCACLSLEGASFVGAKLGKADFSKSQLTGADLTNTNFSECNLSNANLTKCIMDNTSFNQATLIGTLFDESTLNQTTFNGVDASDSSWNAVTISTCDFHDANLASSTWTESTLQKQDMANANLERASFTSALLEQVSFRGNLIRITFENCQLAACSFGNANMETARFYMDKLIDCTFKQSNLSKSNWSQVSAEKSHMDGAILDTIDCIQCNFKHLEASYTSAKKGQFQSCDLSYANMASINLFQGSLRDSVVAGANLSSANLYGADLYLMRPSDDTSFAQADLTATLLVRSL